MSDLQSYLSGTKAAFLRDLASGQPLSNWVIATGNEAGGKHTRYLSP